MPFLARHPRIYAAETQHKRTEKGGIIHHCMGRFVITD